ncbi:unnamed protein product, partial [Phaeothamnion confervicola]
WVTLDLTVVHLARRRRVRWVAAPSAHPTGRTERLAVRVHLRPDTAKASRRSAPAASHQDPRSPRPALAGHQNKDRPEPKFCSGV